MKKNYLKIKPTLNQKNFHYESKYYSFKFSLRKNLTKEQLLDFVMKINPSLDLWFMSDIENVTERLNDISEKEQVFFDFIKKAGLFHLPSKRENAFNKTKPQVSFVHRKEHLINSLLELDDKDLETYIPTITEIPSYLYQKDFFESKQQQGMSYSQTAFRFQTLDKILQLLNNGFSNFGSSILKFNLVPLRFDSDNVGCWKFHGLNFFPNGYVFVEQDTLGRYEDFDTAFKFLKNLAKHCPYLKADFSFYGDFDINNQKIPYLNVKMFDGKIKFQKFNEKVHWKNFSRMIKNTETHNEIFENNQTLDFIDSIIKRNKVFRNADSNNYSEDSLKEFHKIGDLIESKLEKFDLLYYIINERAYLIKQAVKKMLKQERDSFIELVISVKKLINNLDKNQEDYDALVKLYKDLISDSFYFCFLI